MSKENLFKNYLSTAAKLIRDYNGSTPFHDFQKKYFALHKKYGSRDRKQIVHLCYCYFRLGKAVINVRVEKQILIALFFCSHISNELIDCLQPELNKKITASLAEKIALLEFLFVVTNIFPWQDQLSESIDGTAFAASHLTQPDLFLRIRPGKKKQTIQKLQNNNIEFKELREDCLALPNNTKIETILNLNDEAVVQDYSSQRIAEFFEPVKLETGNSKLKTSVWDCCAASGGKSILVVDSFKNIDLTVSDIRASILQNLKNRFKDAGIATYKSYELDLTKPVPKALPLGSGEGFDLIICDAPCTGSGTWGRTPEQLHFFDSKKINEYASLQKKIVSNIIPHLKKGGWFLYITCSIFKKENEEVVDFILANSNLQLVEKKNLIGYDKKADTMFGALFRNHFTQRR